MNEDYSAPFFVSYNKRHLFRGVNASGYLPPLEPLEEAPLPEPIIKTIALSRKERDEFNQMKAHILFLEGKINQHLNASKRKRKYKYQSLIR